MQKVRDILTDSVVATVFGAVVVAQLCKCLVKHNEIKTEERELVVICYILSVSPKGYALVLD